MPKSTIVRQFRAPCSFIFKGLPPEFSLHNKNMMDKFHDFCSVELKTNAKEKETIKLPIGNIQLFENSQTRFAVVQFKSYSKNLRLYIENLRKKDFNGNQLKILPFWYPDRFLHPEYFRSPKKKKKQW